MCTAGLCSLTHTTTLLQPAAIYSVCLKTLYLIALTKIEHYEYNLAQLIVNQYFTIYHKKLIMHRSTSITSCHGNHGNQDT